MEEKEPLWVEEIRQQMKAEGLYTELDEQCRQYQKEFEGVLNTLAPAQKEVIERYIQLLNKANYQQICTVYQLGIKDGKVRVGH